MSINYAILELQSGYMDGFYSEAGAIEMLEYWQKKRPWLNHVIVSAASKFQIPDSKFLPIRRRDEVFENEDGIQAVYVGPDSRLDHDDLANIFCCMITAIEQARMADTESSNKFAVETSRSLVILAKMNDIDPQSVFKQMQFAAVRQTYHQLQ